MNKLQNLASPELEYAMDANHAAFWMTIGDHASVINETHFDKKVAWSSSDMDVGFCYNITLPLHLQSTEFDAVIAACIERTRRRGVRSEWWVSPVVMRNGLRERLESSEFTQTREMPGMAVELAKLNEDLPRPANLEIRHVEDEVAFAEWVTTLVEGWPLPDFWRTPFSEAIPAYGFDADLRLFAGYLDGTLAAVSSMMYADGVATRPEFRGRGLGAQMTLAPLLEARDAGYGVGILQASEMGKPVYIRLGFEVVFMYQVFEWPAPDRTSD
jgi:GNAT superfamily N-acetyltransferase